ncbi:hypothetical protein [Streptomyces sp. MBT62]|uniref:hypothetical protein n=1 Tax=Streptomyces sp. MBT62 TaxID=2800410 RepID=UPI00190B732C|nr:hypothetical protein [Streptomyces sp. MBT62]MBK3570963.1 hypothetical protein [Streptomyces sp. MBT62]
MPRTSTDMPGVLAEARRVLKPGGEPRFDEHVRSDNPRFLRAQRIINPLWRTFGGGCNVTRDTERAIQEAGFTAKEIRRFAFRINGRANPGSLPIIGTARPPT